VADNSSPLSFFWPEIDDSASCTSAAKIGVFGASLFALNLVGVALYIWWAKVPTGASRIPSRLAEAAVFAGLAFGIWRMSRAAAIVALTVFLLEQLVALLRLGSVVGLILPVAITLFLISGVRGTVAQSKLKASAGSGESTDA
jgi:hypothetical protein